MNGQHGKNRMSFSQLQYQTTEASGGECGKDVIRRYQLVEHWVQRVRLYVLSKLSSIKTYSVVTYLVFFQLKILESLNDLKQRNEPNKFRTLSQYYHWKPETEVTLRGNDKRQKPLSNENTTVNADLEPLCKQQV